jgi:hypothetical protein
MSATSYRWPWLATHLAMVVGALAVLAPAAAAQSPSDCAAPANEIVAENCKPGTPEDQWDVAGSGATSIQGFATDISVDRGQTVRFKIDTDASDYRLEIYRLGWYGGDGARRIDTVQPSASLPQAQGECQSDAETGLVDCGNWAESASWTVAADATSGLYLARLVREDGTAGASHIPFVVRDDAGRSDVLFQTSDTTWQAYNTYGGKSLYAGGPGTNPGRAYKVSYNRPFTTRGTSDEDWLFNSEYPMIRWLERNGYDVSYFTGVDSDRRGAEIAEHGVFLSVGHDEYWSGAQRSNVEAARDAGVHLAFFSGNESFWKTRWEDDHRTLISYKETHADASIDPTDIWTGTWRDPRPFNPEGGRPENALTGTMFTVNSGSAALAVPAEDGRMRLWRNTSVAGQAPGAVATLTEDAIGYEWDEDVDNGARPAGLIRLSSTTVANVEKLQDYGSSYGPGTATHHLTLYRDTNDAGKDALVFGAGTVQWPWGLDGNHDRGGSTPSLAMQQATVNLFADMDVQPATPQDGVAPAVASTDTAAPTSVIGSPAAESTVEQGRAVTIEGTASDEDGEVGGVEVSVDGGDTWHPATGRATWRYSWTPAATGTVTIHSRATDDSGNLETPTAGVAATVGGPQPAMCPCTVFDASATPSTGFNDGQPIELGMRFRSDEPGFITGVRFYKRSGGLGTHLAHLWTNDGLQLAEAAFTGESASGWQQVDFASPVQITAGTTYVVSYHSSFGDYAADTGYFTAGVDAPPLHALATGVDGANGVYRYGLTGFPTETFQASNYWVDAVFERTTGPDTTAPKVAAVTPATGATGVPVSTTVTARFDEAVDVATIDGATFTLRDAGGAAVAADVAYSAATRTATLTPRARLAYSTAFTATVKGGSDGVADAAGNRLAADRTWSFTTEAPAPPPPDSADPFTSYYAEILRAEGLNEFEVKDADEVTAQTLAGSDVVLLAQRTLSDEQVVMLSDWVQAGGNLIAMRPDAKLAALLGLQPASGSVDEGYVKVDTATAPGAGITAATMQFHGRADLYTLAGAREVAALYTDADTGTANPAVTLRDVGANNGQAAAFAYDLARSIVYTRQGNPAWAGDSRDGQDGPIRSDNLFYGAKPGDVQTDWVNLAKVTIPQADEQQRLLANLITEMLRDRLPLPRLWYFPRGEKAAVVMTGDDHGAGGTAGQFARFASESPAGCSIADWECIRATSYLYPGAPLTDGEVAAYQADGFELGLHLTTNCDNFTAESLEANWVDQLAEFSAKWPSLVSPRTNRTHCIAWSDWVGEPKAELAHGVRFDTNYYYWPEAWVQDRPGMFTGSGMPMRFADLDGSLIDVYQAATQITDESGQEIPKHIKALLDGALGADGYYGAFTVNMHTDQSNHAGANAIVAEAKARSVPVVSARQMLDWVDARNASSFQELRFADGRLQFTMVPGATARGLEAMLPAESSTGPLTKVTRNGADVATTSRTVKGVEYAVFPAQAGDYVASYAADTTAPAITGIGATAHADGTATISWQTDEPATSRVEYGTSADVLTGSATAAGLATEHTVELSGLQAGTQYFFRVESRDGADNAATAPASPADFTTPAATLLDTTVADFTAGDTGTATSLSADGDGEVILRPLVAEEFGGSALPAGWTPTSWGTGGTATVGGGSVTVDGARANGADLYGPDRALEFVARFGGEAFQHVGFGAAFEDAPWAMFSTGGGALSVGLYARTWGASQQNTAIAGVDPTIPHRYRIEWTATGVDYWVDGAKVVSHPGAVTGEMRPIASDFNVGGGTVSVDWLRMTPFAGAGTFTSRVLDAGRSDHEWSGLDADVALPAGTQATFETRSGSTATPDASWSSWQPVGGGGAIASPVARYIQYRAALTTADPAVTPVLRRVAIGVRADTTAPEAPGKPDLDAAGDTGSSDSDDITRDTTPTFSGAAEAGSSVRLLVGGQVRGTAVASGGSWSITSDELGDGSHEVTVTATDAAGNTSAASPALSVTIDTAAPKATVTGVTIDGHNGTVTFVAGEPGATFECRLDRGPWTACASPKQLTGLAAGRHTIAVRAGDRAGNTGTAPDARTFTVATTVAPSPPVVTPPVVTPPDTVAPRPRIVTRRVRSSRKGTVALRVSLPAAEKRCRVRIDLRLGRRRLARRTVTARAGTATVRLHLSKWAQRRLALRRRLRVTVITRAADASGNTATRSTKITLRAPARS